MTTAEKIQIEQTFLEESEKSMIKKNCDIENRELKILYVDHNDNARNHLKSLVEYAYDNKFSVKTFDSGYQAFKWLEEGNTPDVIISEYALTGMSGIQFLRLIRISSKLKNIPFIFLTHQELTKNERQDLLKAKADDLFYKPFKVEELTYRIKYLFKLRNFNPDQNGASIKKYKLPLVKRIFDIVFSGLALLFLLPLFLIVGAIIKLESKGPVFYKSKRVGMGYQIFDLIKFRSMASGSDKNLEKLKHLNLYNNSKDSASQNPEKLESKTTLSESEIANVSNAKKVLISDNQIINEEELKSETETNKEPIFMKFKDDPRVTPFGRFIRNTSIDELPQLINVLIGDISIVGNRPLPLYEAEKLTTDAWSERFMAPAGITGLWQVVKRGKSDMSEGERIALDNRYAQNCSLAFDMKIILKTFPALLQSENV